MFTTKHGVLGVAAATLAISGMLVTSLSAVAEPPPEGALDHIPGLRASADGVRSDDAIAYWESYRRSLVIAECMADAGFEWFPEAHFPDAAVLAVAETLGVDVTPAPGRDPVAANLEVERHLSTDDRDRYLQTLYAETAEEIDHMRDTGSAPQGAADSFATGGCMGEGSDSVTSIWALKRAVSEDLAQMRSRAARTEAFAHHARAFSECVEDQTRVSGHTPASVEAALLEGSDQGLDEATAGCLGHWREAHRAGTAEVADEFVDRHRNRIEAQQKRYRGVMNRIRNDRQFLDFLEDAASRIAHERQ